MTQAGLLGLWESKFSEATPTAQLSTLNQGVDCYVRMYMCYTVVILNAWLPIQSVL